ncbi:MAG: RIP metalloprotease RseP [Acidiferrobacterales bacterium]
MIDIIYTVIAFIVALGILIAFHEFGHYWVAKRLGVKVLRFSIGFGKPLWVRRFGRDQTELVVAALPLGGYVKMLDETEGDVPEADKERAFNRQSIPKRVAIVVAGPLFNFLFAVLAYSVLYTVGIDGIKPIVGRVIEGSIAEQGGFRIGDELLAIDGKEVLSWDHRRLRLFERALNGRKVQVEVRDPEGAVRTRVLDLSNLPPSQINAGLLERGLGLYGYIPEIVPVIGAIGDGPALNAGIQVGDRIAKIDGKPIESWEDVVKGISPKAGKNVRITVDRAGELITFDVTPEPVKRNGETVGQIKIRPRYAEIPAELRVRVRFGLGQAVVEGITSTWSMSVLTVKMLIKMLQLEVSTKNISGPLTIAQYAGHTAKVGPDRFIMFLAVVSISLGVLNLLPIPVLDGGHLLYYFIEAIKGSPVSERVMIWGQQFGILLLIGLMMLAFYNDFTRIFQ